jgi:hypothetical protein
MTRKEKPLAIIVHVASKTLNITVHDLHNAMKCETTDAIVAEWKSWDCTFLKTTQRSHSHHTSLYILHNSLHSQSSYKHFY